MEDEIELNYSEVFGDEDIQEAVDPMSTLGNGTGEPKETYIMEVHNMHLKTKVQTIKVILVDTFQVEPPAALKRGLLLNYIYVAFKDEATRAKAIQCLDGFELKSWKANKITARAHPDQEMARNFMHFPKMRIISLNKEDHGELSSYEEKLQKSLTPQHTTKYEAQLNSKNLYVARFLKKFSANLPKENVQLTKFSRWQSSIQEGQICPSTSMKNASQEPSFIKNEELYIGRNSENGNIVIGHWVRDQDLLKLELVSVQNMKFVDDKVKQVAKSMEAYLEMSRYEPCDVFTIKGVWHELSINASNNNEILVIITIAAHELTEDQLEEIKLDLKIFFSEGEGAQAGITSLFIQKWTRKVNQGVVSEPECVFGNPYINYEICGKKFRTSLHDSLKINLVDYETLVKEVVELADVGPDTTVIDLTCGNGVIALLMAKNASKVLGVDSRAKSIEDARENARQNDVNNATFYEENVSEFIDKLLEGVEKPCTVIINSFIKTFPRTVVVALRKCLNVTKIINVGRNFHSVMHVLMEFCRTRNHELKNLPFFVPNKLASVDTYPHTYCYAAALSFERYDEDKWDKLMGDFKVTVSHITKQKRKKRLKTLRKMDSGIFTEGRIKKMEEQSRRKSFHGNTTPRFHGGERTNNIWDRLGRGDRGRSSGTRRAIAPLLPNSDFDPIGSQMDNQNYGSPFSRLRTQWNDQDHEMMNLEEGGMEQAKGKYKKNFNEGFSPSSSSFDRGYQAAMDYVLNRGNYFPSNTANPPFDSKPQMDQSELPQWEYMQAKIPQPPNQQWGAGENSSWGPRPLMGGGMENPMGSNRFPVGGGLLNPPWGSRAPTGGGLGGVGPRQKLGYGSANYGYQ